MALVAKGCVWMGVAALSVAGRETTLPPMQFILVLYSSHDYPKKGGTSLLQRPAYMCLVAAGAMRRHTRAIGGAHKGAMQRLASHNMVSTGDRASGPLPSNYVKKLSLPFLTKMPHPGHPSNHTFHRRFHTRCEISWVYADFTLQP